MDEDPPRESNEPSSFEELRKAWRGNGHDRRPKLIRLRGSTALESQPLHTIVRGLLYPGSVVLIYGPPKSGKSFLLIDLLLSIAHGDKKWMGHDVVRPGPVLYVACEGYATFWKRLQAAAKQRGWTKLSFPPDFEFSYPDPFEPRLSLIELVDNGRLAVPSPQAILEQIDAMEEEGHKPNTVVIDTVFRAFGQGNVNLADHMNAFLAACSMIAERGICVILIHHETKSGGSPVGSVSLMGGADTIIRTQNLADGSHAWEVEYAKDEAMTLARKFKLDVVEVEPDHEGFPASSCIVLPLAGTVDSRAEDPWGKATIRPLKKALMNTLVESGREMRPFADGPTVRAVDQEAVRPAFYADYPAAEQTDPKKINDAKRQAFGRAIRAAKNAGVIGSLSFEGKTYLWLLVPTPQTPGPLFDS